MDMRCWYFRPIWFHTYFIFILSVCWSCWLFLYLTSLVCFLLYLANYCSHVLYPLLNIKYDLDDILYSVLSLVSVLVICLCNCCHNIPNRSILSLLFWSYSWSRKSKKDRQWLRPKKNICVFTVTRPILIFASDPMHFYTEFE